jgi:eukaryotic-like serine/threonine-protein kinase
MNTTTDNPVPDIPGWEIVDLLGRGGMGAVYRARSKTLSQLVALKVIDPLYASQPAFRQCFLREISTSVALHHAHILPILNFSPDPDSGSLFFVTPIVGTEDCRSLADLIAKNGKLDPGLAASLLAQVADALAYAHSLESPLIHRDVSPSNILLKTTRSGSYHALLADFGIAFPGTQEAREAVTDPESLIPSAGKPQYMAPEQFDDVEFGPMTARTDLYQLGIVAYECLAGDLPYQETNPIRLSDCHRRTEVPRLTPEQCPDPRWRQLVTELLAKKASDRPEDAATVRNRLFDIARGPQVDQEALAEVEPSAKPQPTPPPSAPVPPAPASPPPRPASEAPTDVVTPPPTTLRRPTPATVVQAAPPTAVAPPPPPRRKRRVGRWILVLLIILIPIHVLIFQFRARIFGPGDDPTPIVQDDPANPADTDPQPPADDTPADPNGDATPNDGGAEPEDEPGEDADPDTPPAADETGDETGEETTDPVNPDDQEVTDDAEEPGDDSLDLSAAPLEYVKGPLQEEFEELLVRACRRLEFTEAEIEALRAGGWTLPQDTPHEALKNLLTLAQSAFARAKNTRSLYEKGPESLELAQTTWLATEQSFTQLTVHWQRHQQRTLTISLQEDQEDLVVSLTPKGVEEPVALIALPVSKSGHLISPARDGGAWFLGTHLLRFTTVDGLHVFSYEAGGQEFDFGRGLPPCPGHQPTLIESTIYVDRLTTEERQALYAKRLEIQVGTLRKNIDEALAEGMSIRTKVQELAGQTIGVPDEDTRTTNLRRITVLCQDWLDDVRKPLLASLGSLSQAHEGLTGNAATSIDLDNLSEAIEKYHNDLEEQNPDGIREEVLSDHHRQLQSKPDSGEPRP